MKTQLFAVPKSGVKVYGKIARPYLLKRTRNGRGLKAWMGLLKFRHGNTVAGIEKVNAETGERISFHSI